MSITIGEQLKQARVAQGLSLEQASRAIHIRAHYLEALENDRRADLPSNVQGRGFLRLYADLLGLPVAPLLAAWDGKAPIPASQAAPHGQIASAANTAALESPPVESARPVPPDASLPPEPTPDPEPPPEGGSLAIFREIGRTLRGQREILGLSLAEVERYTRLRQHYVQALEDGRMEGLPSPVQGKGMLSNYATFLNLDEEAVMLRFAEALQVRRIERLPKPEPQNLFNAKKRPARQAPFWKRFLTPDLIFGIGLAAIILLFVLWTAARIDTQSREQAEPTTPAIAEILLTPAGLRPGLAATGSPTREVVAGENTGPESTAEAGTPAAADPATGADVPPTDAAQVPPAGGAAAGGNATLAVPTPTLAPFNNDPLQVYIIAHARAWLKVTADGKVAFLGRVVPGNAYAYSGAEQVELLTGNAAALQVIFNQNDLGTLGLTGEVVGLVFNAAGVVTPTPAFTATPTQTPIATVTPLPSPTLPATPTVTPFIPED
jgi:cytoskeletal protein RodZ